MVCRSIKILKMIAIKGIVPDLHSDNLFSLESFLYIKLLVKYISFTRGGMMIDEDILKYKGKKVKLFLKTNLVFTGRIIEVHKHTIEFFDKNSDLVSIDISSIDVIRLLKKEMVE